VDAYLRDREVEAPGEVAAAGGRAGAMAEGRRHWCRRRCGAASRRAASRRAAAFQSWQRRRRELFQPLRTQP